MNTVKVRNIILGEGMPKICVPITGRTKEEISLRLEEALGTEADLLEWRADWYEQALERERLLEMLDFLRAALGERPLLVTFRTREEGGEQEAPREASRGRRTRPSWTRFWSPGKPI